MFYLYLILLFFIADGFIRLRAPWRAPQHPAHLAATPASHYLVFCLGLVVAHYNGLLPLEPTHQARLQIQAISLTVAALQTLPLLLALLLRKVITLQTKPTKVLSVVKERLRLFTGLATTILVFEIIKVLGV